MLLPALMASRSTPRTQLGTIAAPDLRVTKLPSHKSCSCAAVSDCRDVEESIRISSMRPAPLALRSKRSVAEKGSSCERSCSVPLSIHPANFERYGRSARVNRRSASSTRHDILPAGVVVAFVAEATTVASSTAVCSDVSIAPTSHEGDVFGHEARSLVS